MLTLPPSFKNGVNNEIAPQPEWAERRSAMRYIGMDVHAKQTYFCVKDSGGKRIRRGKVMTNELELGEVVSKELKEDEVSVAIEATTTSWFVQDVLVRSGAKVEVTNPYKLKLISESRSKTDKADAEILAELLRCGGLPTPVYVPSIEIRNLRKLISLRRRLIRIRTQLINAAKSFMRGQGIQASVREFHTGKSWLNQLERYLEYAWYLKPLSEVYYQVESQISQVESELHERYSKNDYVIKLRELPGVGPVVAYTILSSIGDPTRFSTSKQVAAYSGLVPSERSSGESIVKGGITHEGRRELREMLVQGAWAILRTRRDEAMYLKRYYYKLMHKRGSQVAIIALARKLLTIAYQVMKGDRFSGEKLFEKKTRAEKTLH